MAQNSSSTSEPATSSAPLPWPCAAAGGAAASHARRGAGGAVGAHQGARRHVGTSLVPLLLSLRGTAVSSSEVRLPGARARALGSRGGADPLPSPPRGGVAMRGGKRARGGERGGVVRVFCHLRRRPHARHLDSNLAAAPLRRPPQHARLALAPCPAPVLAPHLCVALPPRAALVTHKRGKEAGRRAVLLAIAGFGLPATAASTEPLDFFFPRAAAPSCCRPRLFCYPRLI